MSLCVCATRRFGKRVCVKFSAAAAPSCRRPQRWLPLSDAAATPIAAAGDRAASVARAILRICDHSSDVPGEIEALLRDEFAKVARHA